MGNDFSVLRYLPDPIPLKTGAEVDNQTFVATVEKLHDLYDTGMQGNSLAIVALFELAQACHNRRYSILASAYLKRLATEHGHVIDPMKVIQFLGADGWFLSCNQKGRLTFIPGIQETVRAMTAFHGQSISLVQLDQVIDLPLN